ncbi:MAG TPA: preprotein translocase subunit SecG [Bacteroidales bacterium]|nr:preprotein translocase subunit SecG [Bacteroidales bacterium]HPR57867.1 preprotein translocase subunit SecG [Bacteroidales bacterium]
MGLFILLTVLILIAAVLIILVVLVQNSKGGGLASNFAGSNQYMGVRKTADFLEKATWSLAVFMLLFVLVSSKVIPKHQKVDVQVEQSEIIESIENLPIQATEPFDPSKMGQTGAQEQSTTTEPEPPAEEK